MNLPNYFLADLPNEVVTPAVVAEACQTLKRNREQYLAQRSTRDLIAVFDRLAREWRNPENPFRKRAINQAEATGFTGETLRAGLDDFFAQITGENLELLVSQEFGHAERLDDLVATAAERRMERAAMARGPELIAHIAGGVIPNPTILNVILGVLVRAAQFVKCASATALLPRLFAHSLYEAEPKLGACLEIAEWRGGNERLESPLFLEAECVTATGSDKTLAAIRSRMPEGRRFLGFGHRVSFGYITRDVLTTYHAGRIAAKAADDVAAWNQLGCLSPHAYYVEQGGQVSAEQFAEMLSSELAKLEEIVPRGAVAPEIAATIANCRAFYEVRAAHSPHTQHWFSDGTTHWTVIYESDPQFQVSCLHRFIYVKKVISLAEALHGADQIRGQVSTVGLAAAEQRAPQLALDLARWGATRICPIGQMQNPPLTWRHDGRPTLGDLVTWTDWERQ